MAKEVMGDPRFDMARPLAPITARGALRQRLKGLGFSRLHSTFTDLEAFRSPCLVLTNYPSPLLMPAMAALVKKPLYFACPIELFIGREEQLRQTGAIGVRPYTQDIRFVRHLSRAVGELGGMAGSAVAFSPSPDGRGEGSEASWGRIAKVLGVDLVTVCFHGLYLRRPLWAENSRNVPVHAEARLLLTARETQTLSPEEIAARISRALRYDDYAWQREKKLLLREWNRAEGLHRILYRCPVCGQHRMTSAGQRLRCRACGSSWLMRSNSRLEPEKQGKAYTDPTAWVDEELSLLAAAEEAESLSLDIGVKVAGMVGSAGYGEEKDAQLVVGAGGLMLEGALGKEHTVLFWETGSQPDIPVSYEGGREYVQLSTLTETYRIALPENVPAARVSHIVREMYRRVGHT